MAFFFLDKLKQQKELEKKRQEEQNLAYWQSMLEIRAVHAKYCDWYSLQVSNFVNELRQKNFMPNWGFEVEDERHLPEGVGGKKTGSVYLFDYPPLEGVAFDNKSKQMLYYKFPSGYYKKYSTLECDMVFEYYLLPFSELYCANIEVNSQQICSTAISQNDVLSRSVIGGVVGGEVGALIGGLSSPSTSVTRVNSIPQKITFNIFTLDEMCPKISIEFCKSYAGPGEVSSNKFLYDALTGTFSKNGYHAHFYESTSERRQISTTTDYVYERWFYDVEETKNRVYPEDNLERILSKLRDYASKIDFIIRKFDTDKKQLSQSSNVSDVISELTKLSELKEKGIITDEEFLTLKSKLL